MCTGIWGLKFRIEGTYAKVWFSGRMEIQTGKVVAASMGSLLDNT